LGPWLGAAGILPANKDAPKKTLELMFTSEISLIAVEGFAEQTGGSFDPQL
jgi:hypothetical protein